MKGFLLGCNYLASHAAIFMWRDWRPDIVEADFLALSKHGMNTLRVFPVWSDFQPITPLIGAGGQVKEFAFGERALPDDEAGRSGVDVEMIGRFEVLTELAKKYGLKLIVGMINGWLSGRLFIPPALYGRNLLTDPTAIKWEIKFISFFVRHFKNQESIIAWDLGNECNNMAPLENSEQAWLWSRVIASAIREADPSRPVVSGLHGLSLDGIWRIQDQSETIDILTTHPYPIFTPHCNNDPLNTMRPILHATAESLFYSGIGKKPCLVEEAGTLTGCISGDQRSSEYLRASLFAAWAHNLEGYLWWCAFDQVHMTKTPYDWHFVERELGLMSTAYQMKTIFTEMEKFAGFLGKLPVDKLPAHIKDGICLVGKGTDAWGIAYNTYALACRAGLAIEFQSCEDPIKDAPLYLVPSVGGYEFIKVHRYHELMDKIFNGATLYMSLDCPYLGEYEKYFGIKIKNRIHRQEKLDVHFNIGGVFSLTMARGDYLDFDAVDQDILAVDENGNPAYIHLKYGKGSVYLLNFPLEANLVAAHDPFSNASGVDLHRIYKVLSSGDSHVVRTNDPGVVTTEHPLGKQMRLCVSVNCMPHLATNALVVREGWKTTQCLYGASDHIPACDVAVYIVTCEGPLPDGRKSP